MKLSVKVGVFAVALCLPLGLCAAGCAPQTAKGDAGGDEAPSGTVVAASWSPDIDCAACHQDESSTSQDAACLAGTHTMDQGFDCMTCHADESALSTAHANMNSGKMPKKLKNTEVSQDLCLSCHNQDELASTTAASTVLTDNNGKTVNPHAIPENADHVEEIKCTSCHTGHSTAGIEQESTDFCAGCHHADVYECGTCHEE